MAAVVVCVVRLETGEQKKVVLPTGSYDELVHALSTHTAVDEQTLLQVFDTEVDEYIDLEKDCTILSKSKIKVGRKVLPPTTDPTSSECIEAGPSFRTHDPSREHLNQSADSICTTELVEIHVPLRKQYDYLEFRLPAFGPYEEVLQRGEPVEGPVRRTIINRIFQACFKSSMVSFEGAVQHSSGTAYSELPASMGLHQKRDRHDIGHHHRLLPVRRAALAWKVIGNGPSSRLSDVTDQEELSAVAAPPLSIKGLLAPDLPGYAATQHRNQTPSCFVESQKLALKNKFKNNRKKTQNISEEMEAMRVMNAPKRPRVLGPEEIKKKLCRLSDNPELIVYGETAKGRRRHHEWLTENASTAGEDELWPRLLATAKERHERLERMTIQQALLEYPFLATEHSLQLELNLLFKKNILDEIMKGFECLCGMILSHGHQKEVTDFSTLASESRHATDALHSKSHRRHHGASRG
ncbi:uncharacterized protein LOC142803899 [Rhipicephalus microplus]|uniref:uncharacterized protein LOC142803899 n=1 Tax=Rhipicephalus microplus TaxID=6941 RepID=UPI003F6BF278